MFYGFIVDRIFNLAGSHGAMIYSNAMVIYRLNRSRSRTLSTENRLTKEKEPADTTRINIYEEHELNYWIKELNVSKEELRMAVMEVGTSAEAVKKYLEEKNRK
jgi:hypothetical protein